MNDSPIILILVPGLGRGLLRGGALPELGRGMNDARTAGLVPSFPCLPATVEASALRGQLPARHGVRLPGDDPDPTFPTVGERLAAIRPEAFFDAASRSLPELGWRPGLELLVVRHPQVLEAAVEHGIRSQPHLDAAAEFDTQLGRMRSTIPPSSTVLVSTAPGVRAARRVIELPPPLQGLSVRRASAVLWVDVEDAGLAGEVQQQLLSLRGVERILQGEGLQSWGASSDPASTELLALAQPGWSFEEQAAAFGHPELPEEEAPLLIAFSAGNAPPWPGELHDYRLAPSLARRLGLEENGYLDRAFAL